MYGAWSVGPNCRKEVLRFKAVGDVFEFLAVASKEDGAGSWAVTAADHVALDEGWAICVGGEGLVVAAISW